MIQMITYYILNLMMSNVKIRGLGFGGSADYQGLGLV